MAKSKLAVGLDIGSSGVKLVQLKERKGGYALQAFGTAPLPPEAIVDGALMNSAAIVSAIQELVAQQKVKTKEVAIGVRGHSVIIKKISLPRMTQEELDESIQWEAEQYIPFDVKDVNIDTQILTPEGDAAGQMDVLLVAAAVANINILAKGNTTFTRDITMGGNAFTEEIQKQLNISYDEAEALKVGGQGETDAVVPQEVERVIQGVAEQMAGEIQRSLDFYAATAADSRIARVYLSGGTARIPALFKVIEARAGVPVEILNPFKNIEVDNRRFDPAVILAAAPSVAVGVGLALRRPGDK
jgi:type IV pilus assembly protein PilM